MKLIYKGGNAKSPMLGVLKRGKIYEVNSTVANQLLANKTDWQVASMVKEQVKRETFKKEEIKMDNVRSYRKINRGGDK